MQTKLRPPPNGQADPFDPDSVVSNAQVLPDRILFYGPEKWGKTSFAAQADAPLFLMSAGEDGLVTLIRTGQLPPRAHFPTPCTSWNDANRALSGLIVKGTQAQTFVLDTLNGFERLCFEETCRTKCDSDWAKFDAYGRGPNLAVPLWTDFLAQLDRLRQQGLTILALCHAAVERVPNPAGLDYERFAPAMHKRCAWPLTHKWADMILFGTLETTISKVNPSNKTDNRAKALGGNHRVIYTQPNAAFAAGNRHGLPEEIDCGESAAEAYANFQAALQPTEAP